jgi:hypothetical protein
MPDITMCTSTTCVKRHSCYRAMVIPTPLSQAVCDFNVDAPCGHYSLIDIDKTHPDYYKWFLEKPYGELFMKEVSDE